jgi:ComF family protein
MGSIDSGAAPPGTNSRTSHNDRRSAAAAAANLLLSTLFEPPCAACKQRLLHPLAGAVCAECWASVRLAPRIHEQYGVGHAISASCAVDRYEGRMKDIIHSLKYERRRSIAAPLGRLMRECGAALLSDATVVVPVPLHSRRQYQRGFNQAYDLAQQLGLPVAPLLQRTVFTASQIELPRDRRQDNVRHAFALSPDRRSLITDPCIAILVDDVSTTGATLEACARVLRNAGVKEVRALTAARVVNERR